MARVKLKLGEKHDGLYVLPYTVHSNGKVEFAYLPMPCCLTAAQPSYVAAPAKLVNPNQLVHQRFVHISDAYIYRAVELGIVTGVLLQPRPSRFTYPFCDACALAKSTRVSSSRTPGSSHRRIGYVKPAGQTTVTEEDFEPVLDTGVDDFASTLEGDFPTLEMVS